MGYLPIDVDAYEVGGNLRYAAVWQENIEGLNWYEWQDLTSEQFSSYFDQYQADYRMIDVESYQSGGQQYYAGIWVENSNHRGWAEYRNMTSKDFHQTWAALRDAGYRLIDYELYPTGAGWRYAGVWRQNGDRLNWALKDNVDALVEAYFTNNNLPGMSVAIAQNGTFRYLRGLGYKDVDDAVTTDSRSDLPAGLGQQSRGRHPGRATVAGRACWICRPRRPPTSPVSRPSKAIPSRRP